MYFNQRRVMMISTAELGVVGIVAVGATCVGSIVTTVAVGDHVVKGEDIGRFEFGGSTILLLFQPGVVVVASDLAVSTSRLVETYVRMGTEIGLSPPPASG